MFQKYVVLFLTIILIIQFLQLSALRSGLYIDNGIDQTIMHHELTNLEKQEMENGLLNILGLPNRPPRKAAANETNLKRSSTRFLMEIYKTLMEKENTGRMPRDLPEMNISQQELNIIDAVMTFESHDNQISGVRHERGKRLWFDVSEIPAGETIMTAEIRLYQDPEYAKLSHSENTYTITVYEIVTTLDGERELEYVTAVNTTSNYEGWLELNITRSLNTWVAFPHSNLGVYLSVHPANKPGHEIKPDDIGIVNTNGDPDKQPFMVAFFKASPASAKKRKPRGVNHRRKASYNSPRKYRDTMIESTQTSRNCKIHNLFVSFKELQWQDWIIAPPGFEAFYCTGECSFPLNAHMNATNHAIVQTLVHLMNPANVPKPCCAPTKLSAISVLYFRDEHEVTLKKYKNMVVKSCGCH